MLSHVWLFAIPWIIAHQSLLSTGFPRQEYWSGMPFPSPGDLPYPGIEPTSPVLAGRFFLLLSHQGSPLLITMNYNFLCVLLYIRYRSKPFAYIIPFVSSNEPWKSITLSPLYTNKMQSLDHCPGNNIQVMKTASDPADFRTFFLQYTAIPACYKWGRVHLWMSILSYFTGPPSLSSSVTLGSWFCCPPGKSTIHFAPRADFIEI